MKKSLLLLFFPAIAFAQDTSYSKEKSETLLIISVSFIISLIILFAIIYNATGTKEKIQLLKENNALLRQVLGQLQQNSNATTYEEPAPYSPDESVNDPEALKRAIDKLQ